MKQLKDLFDRQPCLGRGASQAGSRILCDAWPASRRRSISGSAAPTAVCRPTRSSGSCPASCSCTATWPTWSSTPTSTASRSSSTRSTCSRSGTSSSAGTTAAAACRRRCGDQTLGLIDNWLRHVQDVAQKHASWLAGAAATSGAPRSPLRAQRRRAGRSTSAETTIVRDAWRRGQRARGAWLDLSDLGWPAPRSRHLCRGRRGSRRRLSTRGGRARRPLTPDRAVANATSSIFPLVERARSSYPSRRHESEVRRGRGETGMRRVRRLLLPAIALFAVTSLLASSALAAPVCSATKLKAAGKDSGAKLRCHSKAAKAAMSVDTTCLAKSSDKLALRFFESRIERRLRRERRRGRGRSAHRPASSGCRRGDSARCGRRLADLRLEEARRRRQEVEVSAHLLLEGREAERSGRHHVSAKSRGQIRRSLRAKPRARGGCAVTDDVAAIELIVDDGVAAIVAEVLPTCGDDIATGAEQCDGTDDSACPGECVSSCVCAGDCGNGVSEIAEECDDGNNTSGDGCRDDCVLENASALCTGVTPVAGTTLDKRAGRDVSRAPLFVTAPPLDPRRLFVVEQDGSSASSRTARRCPTPFLDIDSTDHARAASRACSGSPSIPTTRPTAASS